MILRELHLDITPILTGAGIAGVAIGFGAQTLVKDVISGFFLLLENQVRVGDVVTINGTGRAGGSAHAAHDRAARRDRHGPHLSERQHHHAREPDEGLLVLRDQPRPSTTTRIPIA